jgi:hypothetical protein
MLFLRCEAQTEDCGVFNGPQGVIGLLIAPKGVACHALDGHLVVKAMARRPNN